MKKLKTYLSQCLLALCCCVLFSSCFDLVEEIDLKSNGSGSIKATLNMSKSRTKVASLMKLKEINGIRIPSQSSITTEMQTIVKLLRATPGITNVQQHLDFNNYIVTISCSFNTVSALNSFSKTLATHFKSPMGNTNSYQYDSKSRVFTRNYTHSAALTKEFTRIPANDQQMFDGAFYTQITRFDLPVIAQKNKVAKISNTGKAVLLKVRATDIINGKANLANSISLKK